MKKNAIQVLKLAVATGLIWWLVKTKKVTAEPFIQLWGTPWLTAFIFVVIFSLILINNYRWLLLLRGQGIQSSVKQTIPLTFIGMFFNFAMPGAVGGDLVKAYYIAQEHSGSKLRAATSVLMDRVVGLYAIAIIALASIATHADFILASPQLKTFAVFVVAMVMGFTVFFMLGFSDKVRSHDWTHSFLNNVPLGKLVERIYDTVHAYRQGKKQFLLGILLSLCVQSVNIFSFYVIAKTLNYQATLGALFFIVPLGLMAIAVPISPGGLGVGQAVFFTIFGWVGLSGNLGAMLITIFQVAQAILSVIGAWFYFSRKDRSQAAAALVADRGAS